MAQRISALEKVQYFDSLSSTVIILNVRCFIIMLFCINMYLSQECASLADRLINGQVALAQDAEEMFILKKKLSVAERKLAILEKSNTDKPSNVDTTMNNDVKHVEDVEGAGECVREEEGDTLQSEIPMHMHVCREEAEVMTRVQLFIFKLVTKTCSVLS